VSIFARSINFILPLVTTNNPPLFRSHLVNIPCEGAVLRANVCFWFLSTFLRVIILSFYRFVLIGWHLHRKLPVSASSSWRLWNTCRQGMGTGVVWTRTKPCVSSTARAGANAAMPFPCRATTAAAAAAAAATLRVW
jgi:hypothetical protein